MNIREALFIGFMSGILAMALFVRFGYERTENGSWIMNPPAEDSHISIDVSSDVKAPESPSVGCVVYKDADGVMRCIFPDGTSVYVDDSGWRRFSGEFTPAVALPTDERCGR